MDKKPQVMTFDQFNSTAGAIQDPKKVDGGKVEKFPETKFVDQVKRADLTKLPVTQPEYSETKKDPNKGKEPGIYLNEAATPDPAALADIQALNNEIIQMKEDLAKKEADLLEKQKAAGIAPGMQPAAVPPTNPQNQGIAGGSTTATGGGNATGSTPVSSSLPYGE